MIVQATPTATGCSNRRSRRTRWMPLGMGKSRLPAADLPSGNVARWRGHGDAPWTTPTLPRTLRCDCRIRGAKSILAMLTMASTSSRSRIRSIQRQNRYRRLDATSIRCSVSHGRTRLASGTCCSIARNNSARCGRYGSTILFPTLAPSAKAFHGEADGTPTAGDGWTA